MMTFTRRTWPLLMLLMILSLAPSLQAQEAAPLAPEAIPGELVYVPFPVEIALDGDLSDWAGIPFQTVTTGTQPPTDPAENGAFTFAVAADAETLYVAMTMVDATIVAGQQGTDFWNEDSLEFYINFSGNLFTTTYSDGIHQYIISPVELVQEAYEGATYTGNRSADLPIETRLFRTEDGWGLEAAVPMEFLGGVTHGREFGFQANANGSSGESRTVKLIWSSADTEDQAWQNPSVFGRAMFVEAGRSDIPPTATPPPPVPVTNAEQEAQRVAQTDWPALVRAAWEGYKANYIFCGEACGDNMGLIFDPNTQYQAVSEGVGYGLLLAVMLDDQETFDTIYNAGQSIMLNPMTSLYHWRVDNRGNIVGHFSATDAEQDITAALIFAQARVDRGEWTQHREFPYGERARTMIDVLYLFAIDENRYITPSDAWDGTGRELSNPSYFSPTWYRMFDDYAGTDRWGEVLSFGYRTLYAGAGQALGIAPDWSTGDGQPAYDYCLTIDRRRDQCSYTMGYEGIRVLWRVGLDCLWYGDLRACEWARRGMTFLRALPPQEFARMYDLAGSSIIDHQNEVTTGMWLVAAMAAGDVEMQNRLASQFLNHAQHVLDGGYFGETTQYYYNQSLALLAAATFSGDFRNLYDGGETVAEAGQ
ncbi:MAG: glycosyl hydrolase family 8 [bacterium]|nr:glycosyl hydrolase family 8 [bacterium]